MKYNTGPDTIPDPRDTRVKGEKFDNEVSPGFMYTYTDPWDIWTSALNSTNREWTLYWNRFLGCRHYEDSTHDICFHMLIWPNVFDKWRSIKWLREQRNVDIIKNICMWRRQTEAIHYLIAMKIFVTAVHRCRYKQIHNLHVTLKLTSIFK